VRWTVGAGQRARWRRRGRPPAVTAPVAAYRRWPMPTGRTRCHDRLSAGRQPPAGSVPAPAAGYPRAACRVSARSGGSGPRLYPRPPGEAGAGRLLALRLRRSCTALVKLSRLGRTRSPALSARPHVPAIPSDVGAGVAAIGYQVVGRQPDTTHPARRNHGRSSPQRGQRRLIGHDQLTSALPSAAIPEGPASGSSQLGIAADSTTGPGSLARQRPAVYVLRLPAAPVLPVRRRTGGRPAQPGNAAAGPDGGRGRRRR
jgi:hypothetical protein